MNHAHRSVIAVALIALLAACGSAPNSQPAGSQPAASASASAAAEADYTITANDMQFDTETLTVTAGEAFTLALVNEEELPHNVAIYRDESATEEIFIGEYVSGDTIVYDIEALEAGEYYFRCDLHPEINGTLIVEE